MILQEDNQVTEILPVSVSSLTQAPSTNLTTSYNTWFPTTNLAMSFYTNTGHHISGPRSVHSAC